MGAEPGMILHTVTGAGGEYEYYDEWTVAAYLDKRDAERHVKLAQEWADAWYKEWKARLDVFAKNLYAWVDEKNPYDSRPCFGAEVTYSVGVLFVHTDPAKFREEVAVLSDAAREKGWLP